MSEELWWCKSTDAVIIYNTKEKTAEMLETWTEDECINYNKKGELVVTSKVVRSQYWIRYGFSRKGFLSNFKDNYFLVGRL